MKFLIDSDSFLEAILNRPNIAEDNGLIWDLIELEAIEAYVTEFGLDNVISIARSFSSNEKEADEITRLIQSAVKIAYIDSEKLQSARQLPLKDFKSAIELVCAKEYNTIAIVTHQPEKFSGLENYSVPVWNLCKFLEVVNPEERKFDAIHNTVLKETQSNILCCDVYDYLFRANYIKRHPVSATCSIDSRPKSNLLENNSHYFVWREDVLKQLLNLLKSNSPSQVIAICGEVGMGKTSLALQAAQICKEARALGEHSCLPIYDAFVFVSPIYENVLLDRTVNPSKSSFGDYLGYLARIVALTLGDDSINRSSGNEQLQRLYECLGRQKTLLILDDLDYSGCEREKIEKFLEQLPSSTKVIATLRQDDLGYCNLNLNPLGHDETISAIRYILEAEHLVLRDDEILEMSQYCLGNPLAVKIAILQHTNYPGSMIWEPQGFASITDLLHFLANLLFKSLKSACAKILLLVLALARNSFDMEVLIHFMRSGGSSESKVQNSLAELCRLSLVIENGKRYTLNPVIRELMLLSVQQQSSMIVKLYERLLSSYLKLAEVYGGTDWGNWHVNYDFLESEWENLQSVLRWCVANGHYQSFKQLWKQLNHFADLYGYWSDRVVWLDWLIRLSQSTADWATYVFALSRKAWTLTMIDQPDSLVEAESLLDKAWNLRHKADFETQSYLAHHRSVFYIRCKRYQEAEQALLEQRNVLAMSRNTSIESRTLIRHRINFLRDQAKLDYEQGHLDLARKRYEVVLRQAQKINWLRGVCYARNKLADVALSQNDLERAEKHLIAGCPIAKQNRNKRRLAGYERSFAWLEKLRGHSGTAQRWAELAIRHYHFIGMENESQKLALAYGVSSLQFVDENENRKGSFLITRVKE